MVWFALFVKACFTMSHLFIPGLMGNNLLHAPKTVMQQLRERKQRREPNGGTIEDSDTFSLVYLAFVQNEALDA